MVSTRVNVFVRIMLHVIVVGRIGASKRDLRLLGLLPLNGKSWNGGRACLPAVQMAIEDVNANMNILSDYNLRYKWVDTLCDSGTTLYRVFESLYTDAPYVMILGGMCSVASEATAQVTHFWNLTQVSYGSSSPVLSDRTRFPRFFRLTTPDQKHNQARTDLLIEFNWRRVATINQALEFFSTVIDDFVKKIHDTDIKIISQEIFEDDPLTRVQNLKSHDARIIVTAMYEDKARALLCAAYKIGLYGPKIVWVFIGWFSNTFWSVNLDNIDCTAEEMSLAAEGSFITVALHRNPVEERGIANMTANEFDERFHNYPTSDKESQSYNFVANECYDTIWVAAMALNCTCQIIQKQGSPDSLDMFTYADRDISETMYECMGNTSLTGVSGRVAFTNGDPDKIIHIERIQNGTREPVGLYRQDKEPKYFEWIEGAIRWKGGIIPRDATYITYDEKKIPITLYIFMTSFAALGIGLTLSLFAFNIVYRHNSYVKMSSPNINNVLLLGCLLCYCTVFFKTTETESAAVCKVRIFFFSLGFTLTFAALFSKTWRVYRIFTNKKLLKRSIKDYQLLAIIGCVSAVVLVIIIIWEAIGPHRVQIRYMPRDIYIMGNDAEVIPFVRVCQSDYSIYFGWVLYIIEGAMLSFGAFLAWETRHVKLPALNDSQQIGLCVYNEVILGAVGLTLSLILDNQEVLMYGVTSGFLIISTALTQIIIFVPKIQAVRNKVAGANHMSTVTGLASDGNQSQSPRLPVTAPSSVDKH